MVERGGRPVTKRREAHIWSRLYHRVKKKEPSQRGKSVKSCDGESYLVMAEAH